MRGGEEANIVELLIYKTFTVQQIDILLNNNNVLYYLAKWASLFMIPAMILWDIISELRRKICKWFVSKQGPYSWYKIWNHDHLNPNFRKRKLVEWWWHLWQLMSTHPSRMELVIWEWSSWFHFVGFANY